MSHSATSQHAQFSEVLLRDLRVVDTAAAILELGQGGSAVFVPSHQPILHVVLEGTTWLNADDPGVPPLKLTAGDTVLIFYGDRHSLSEALVSSNTTNISLQDRTKEEPALIPVASPPVRAIVMSCALDLAYVSPAALSIRAASKIWSMRADVDTQHNRAIIGDLAQWRAALRGPGARAFAGSLASLHFVHSMRNMYRTLWPDQPMEVRAPVTRWLAAAIQAVHNHPDRPWTVASLAHEVGLSRSRFAALFMEHIGTPPLAYLTKVRMTQAAHLLELESMPSIEIARRCGYPVHTSFARAFLAFHGLPPKEYLARHRASICSH